MNHEQKLLLLLLLGVLKRTPRRTTTTIFKLVGPCEILSQSIYEALKNENAK